MSVQATAMSEDLGDVARSYLSDTLSRYSWYFQHSTLSDLRLDVETVWEDYVGTGIKVGVIDTQIDFHHADLSTAYDTTLDYNFAEGTDDYTYGAGDLTNTHGTMVAGVIAAEGGNKVGSVGIAPGATLVGLAVDYSSASAVDQVLAALRAAVELDVVNNSWGFSSAFADNFQKSAYADFADAMQALAEIGRDGLGTSVVFSAGNKGGAGSSNYHNLQNSTFAITVGAIDRDGDVSSFSSRGANVLVSAGGSKIQTTTIDDEYTKAAGTSFSAPAVTAVVALMLEANPDLGYRDVQQILALTARKDGLSDVTTFEDGWRTNGATGFNGGGMHYSDAAGYGFVNAHDAVRLAETWTKQQTLANRATVESAGNAGVTVEAGVTDTVSFDIEVTEDIRVEHVEFTMKFPWLRTGDIDVYLISPDGTSVRLVYDLPDVSSAGAIKNFTFTSVATMGEMSAGTWTVEIVNNRPDLLDRDGMPVTGTVSTYDLTIHGSDAALEDDLYVYTDEFGLLYAEAELAARSVLKDTNGGVDTINVAAVTSDTVIDLSGKTASVVAGVTLDIDGAEIENIFAGDGDDTLTGNGADNWFDGGRGDDVLYFSAGEDTLAGGLGEDTLVFDMSLGSITGYIDDAGDFFVGLLDGAYSLVTGIEVYSFAEVTYSLVEFVEVLETPVETPVEDPDDTPVETPVDEPVEDPVDPPVVEDPAGVPAEDPVEDPVDDVPAEEPVDETPPADGRGPEVVLVGTEADDRLRGGATADDISGLDGDDYLVGNDGADTISGGSGDDMIRGGADADVMFGGAGADTIQGEAGSDDMFGGAGADKLQGGDGDDTMDGGAGADTLKGGAGADTFVFDAGYSDHVDVISDFSVADGDQIMLTGLSSAAATEYEIVQEGRYTYIDLIEGDLSARMVSILGVRGTDLTLSTLSEDSIVFS